MRRMNREAAIPGNDPGNDPGKDPGNDPDGLGQRLAEERRSSQHQPVAEERPN